MTTYPPDWADLMRRERAGHARREETIVAADRDEYRSAARNVSVWCEPQPPTRDDLREPDEWGDDD